MCLAGTARGRNGRGVVIGRKPQIGIRCVGSKPFLASKQHLPLPSIILMGRALDPTSPPHNDPIIPEDGICFFL